MNFPRRPAGKIHFDKHILNIEGSDEAQARCAVALEEVLG
jgi:hypothetical protein